MKLALIWLSWLLAAAVSASGNEIEAGNFHIEFDGRGITGLANPHDPFGAQLISSGQRLNLIARYRLEKDKDWHDLPAVASNAPTNQPGAGELVYSSAAVDGSILVRQTFRVDGKKLDWMIDLENRTNASVEIGDLAINMPVVGPRGEDPKAIFERGFLRHQFISENGSFLYFVRASGAPPFLVVTVQPGTKLEYFSGGQGRGGGPLFIHSAVSGGSERRGTWRHSHTMLKLAERGARDSKAHYGFRFQWADSYDDLRQILFRDGLFDIRAVPGMVIPADLLARFALHTRAHIDSIQAEFPKATKITSLGEPKKGYRVYEAEFRRLGENMLTIHHDGGRTTTLEFFVTEPVETLIKKRSSFIVNRQQIRDPSKWWDGVFGPYDMKHQVVRTIEDPDIFTNRMIYVLTCDDPGLCKAPFVAEKNVSFPDEKEIRALEYYLEHFVWGKLQRTDQETPYPYGVYGTPNWHVDRDAARRKALAEASGSETARRDLSKEHVWRSCDYPHVVMLYFHLYEIAKKYPRLSKYLDAAGYLERAYQTARAFFTYPYEIYPSYYETYKWGLYNELVVLKLADALENEGFAERASWLRAEWEKKVKYFVYDDPYPFRSEYAFDRTAFESSYAFAKYGATHDMQPDTNLWYDIKLKKWYSHPHVSREDSRAFMERQLTAGLSVRGRLEANYFQLGTDPGLSYMTAMGGSGILDYAIDFAATPHDWLQLGYASYLASWCLMNAGPAESDYGFWFPGKESDGAAAWQFMQAKFGRAWMGADVPRGPWPYDGEIDLGFGGALRMAATLVTRDPLFGWIAYGGKLTAGKENLSVIPRDGLRQRLCVFSDQDTSRSPQTSAPPKIKLELDRDGFADGKDIVISKSLKNISFVLENRTGDEHIAELRLSLPRQSGYSVFQDGRKLELRETRNWDYPLSVQVKMRREPSLLEIRREGD